MLGEKLSSPVGMTLSFFCRSHAPHSSASAYSDLIPSHYGSGVPSAAANPFPDTLLPLYRGEVSGADSTDGGDPPSNFSMSTYNDDDNIDTSSEKPVDYSRRYQESAPYYGTTPDSSGAGLSAITTANGLGNHFICYPPNRSKCQNHRVTVVVCNNGNECISNWLFNLDHLLSHLPVCSLLLHANLVFRC